jgi:hypothetical protein
MPTNTNNDNPFEQASLARARADMNQPIVISLPTSKPLTREERQGLANLQAHQLEVALKAQVGLTEQQGLDAVRQMGVSTFVTTAQKFAVLKATAGLDPAIQQLVAQFIDNQVQEYGADMGAVMSNACEHIIEAGKRSIHVEPRKVPIAFAEWFFQEPR